MAVPPATRKSSRSSLSKSAHATAEFDTPGKPATMFVATGTGGLFKTTNLGTTWSAVFEKEAVASIGAVASLGVASRTAEASEGLRGVVN